MTPELKYLAMIATFTSLLWVPYALNRVARNKLSDVVGYPDHAPGMSPWAERLQKAHYNAVENLVAFAALVLVAHALDISNAATTSASAAYFWGRIVHPIAYTLAVPWIRTLSFTVAWGAIICIAWQVLAA